MNDWLHCNKCLLTFSSNHKFFLVECAHTFCENCIKYVEQNKCLVCGKSDSFIEINKDMLSSAQPFFAPFETNFKKLLEVYNFQMMQRQRFFLCHNQKYQYLKKELFNIQQKLKNVMIENRMMRSMLLNARQQNESVAGPFATSTPFTNDNSNFDNASSVSSLAFTPKLPLKPVPGYAQRSYPANQPHLPNTGNRFYRQSPFPMGQHGYQRQNMAPVHKVPPSTNSSMSQLHSKRL